MFFCSMVWHSILFGLAWLAVGVVSNECHEESCFTGRGDVLLQRRSMVQLTKGAGVSKAIVTIDSSLATETGTEFKTVAAAVRALKSKSLRKKRDVTFELKSGLHFLDRRVVGVVPKKMRLKVKSTSDGPAVITTLKSISSVWESAGLEGRSHVYKTVLDSSIDISRVTQLFFGEPGASLDSLKMLFLSRWPNVDVSNATTSSGWQYAFPHKSFMGKHHGHERVLTDPNFPFASINAIGATLFGSYGDSHIVNHYPKVTSVDSSAHTMDLDIEGMLPFRYWLGDTLELLDAPGEFWVDTTSRVLYAWAPDSRDLSKTGTYSIFTNLNFAAGPAFTLKRFGNGVMDGVNFFGCAFKLTNCRGCIVSNLSVKYPMLLGNTLRTHPFKQSRRYQSVDNNAPTITGHRTENHAGNVSNIFVEHSEGAGLVLKGVGFNIENILVSNTGWSTWNTGAIVTHGPNHKLNQIETRDSATVGIALRNWRYDKRMYGERACDEGLTNFLVLRSCLGGNDCSGVYSSGVRGCGPAVWQRGWVFGSGDLCVRADDRALNVTIDEVITGSCGGNYVPWPGHNKKPPKRRHVGVLMKGNFHRLFRSTFLRNTVPESKFRSKGLKIIVRPIGKPCPQVSSTALCNYLDTNNESRIADTATVGIDLGKKTFKGYALNEVEDDGETAEPDSGADEDDDGDDAANAVEDLLTAGVYSASDDTGFAFSPGTFVPSDDSVLAGAAVTTRFSSFVGVSRLTKLSLPAELADTPRDVGAYQRSGPTANWRPGCTLEQCSRNFDEYSNTRFVPKGRVSGMPSLGRLWYGRDSQCLIRCIGSTGCNCAVFDEDTNFCSLHANCVAMRPDAAATRAGFGTMFERELITA